MNDGSSLLHDYALGLLGRKEYSVDELRKKLTKKFPDREDEIETCLVKFQEQNFLSDDRFCEMFIEHQKTITRVGPRTIFQKLLQKGIDPSKINAVIAEHFSHEQQRQVASELAEKKWALLVGTKKLEGEALWKHKQKLKNYLVGRGFSFEIIENATQGI